MPSKRGRWAKLVGIAAAVVVLIDLLTSSIGLIQAGATFLKATDLTLLRGRRCEYQFVDESPQPYSAQFQGNVGHFWYSVPSGCGRSDPLVEQARIEQDGSRTTKKWMTNITDKDAGSKTADGKEFYEEIRHSRKRLGPSQRGGVLVADDHGTATDHQTK